MVLYEEIKKRFFYEGVELASFVGIYPSVDEYPHISDFYGELVKRSYEWFCEELCETLKTEYEGNSDSKKRFKCEVCYYQVEFKLTEDEKGIYVSCDVSFKMGRKKTLARFNEVQYWNEKGERMIRPRKKRRAR